MKKFLALLYALIIALLIPSLAFPASFFWKASLAELNAIAGVSNGDRGIVIADNGATTIYYRAGGAWVAGTYAGITSMSFTGNAPWIDVTAYGAICDGTYDNSAKLAANRAAIVASIAAAVLPYAPTYPAGTVLIPIGNCMWSGGDILVPFGVNVSGFGNSFSHGSGLGSSDNSALVLSGGYSSVSHLFLYGAGLRLDHAGHNSLDTVSLRGWDEAGTTGLDLFVSIWNTIKHVDVTHYDNGIVLRPEANGNDSINNNTFIGVKSSGNLNHGWVSRGSYGNSFIGINAESNGGRGIYYTTYNGVETTDTLFAWIIGYKSASDTWINPWFESNAQEDIYVFNGAGVNFQDITLNKTMGATYRAIEIRNSKNIKVSGTLKSSESPYIDRSIGIYGSYGTDLSGLDWYGKNVYVDQGINTKYPNEVPIILTPSGILGNASFATLGGGGADTFSSWTESNNEAGTGTITADNTDLIRPTTHSGNSCKFTNEANPAYTMGIQQSVTVSASTLYYLVIEYKNDTVDPGNPFNVHITDLTNTKYWNSSTWTWDSSQGSDQQLPLPISGVPTSISIPFLTQDNTATVRAAVHYWTSGAYAANSVGHIYSISIQKSKWANP